MRKVKFYDETTHSVSEIPVSELAPEMREVILDGVGKVWIRTGSLRQGALLHPPFEPELKQLIQERIARPLAEVMALSLEQWEEGFRRDYKPEQEIGLWMMLAERYREFVKANLFNKPQRLEAFKLMVHCTSVPSREAFWETASFQYLKRNQVETLIEPFQKNWAAREKLEKENTQFLESYKEKIGAKEFEEFSSKIRDAALIAALGPNDEPPGRIVFGKDRLKLFQGTGAKSVTVFTLDYQTEEEFLFACQLVDAIKGYKDR